MQEQLCRNKILVEVSHQTGLLQACCASATLETKSKIAICLKNSVIHLKSSSFKELVPISIIFKAMGVESDKAIVELLNPFLTQSEASNHCQKFEPIIYLSFEPLCKNHVLTREDAINYLSTRIKYLFKTEKVRSASERMKEVKEILSKIILPHIRVQ